MIKITRLNKTTFVLNCELIETVEETPDTVITTTDGRKYIVTDSIDDIIGRIVEFRARILKTAKEMEMLQIQKT